MADEKRYQVFVSSTYTDLADERAAVIQAILRMDHLPAGMEMFPSADESQWELIEQVIDQSDYYVVVVAGRYGSIIDAEGISYTEKEYDYAVKSGIPVLGFVHKNPGQISASNTDLDKTAQELLDKFRDKVKSKPVNFFESPAELGGLVVTSLMQATKKKPGIGWVRGDKAMTVETERRMLELEQQLEKTEQQRRSAESALVADTSSLSQGHEVAPLLLDCEYWGETDDEAYERSVHIDATWDEIFAAIGILMIDEATTTQLYKRAQETLCERVAKSDLEVMESEGAKRYRATLDRDGWETIELQFRALGLIESGVKRRGVADHNKYLALTERGLRHLAITRAIRSEESAPE